jgi:hypothetical protein
VSCRGACELYHGRADGTMLEWKVKRKGRHEKVVFIASLFLNRLDVKVSDTFVSVWESFNRTIPHKLWKLTVHWMRDRSLDDEK